MSLTTPADFIYSLRSHGIRPVEFCTHLIHTAATNHGRLTHSDTAEEFGIHLEAAEYLHNHAAEFGLLSYPSANADHVEAHQSTITEFIHFLTYFNEYATDREVELLANDSVHTAELTVSVPPSFENQPAELMARLTRFVRNAEENLIVVTPFFTQFGVDAFVDHLAQATSRGVHVTIITRDVTNNTDNAEYISQIHNTVANQGSSQNLGLFEYDSEDGNLHAKALIADSDIAYVGSANFTNYSLKEAIEIGVIVRGPVVEELTDFITTIQTSSDTKQLNPRAFTS